VKELRKSLGILACLFVVGLLVTPAFAVGPAKSADKNPNVSLNPGGNAVMDNPSGSRRNWGEDEIVFWLDASKANGVINNAINADIAILQDMAANPDAYDQKWIYLSGEHYGNMFMGHGMFYWVLRALGYSSADALAIALERAPDGFYLRSHDLGIMD
jgi:hypothetical protein